MSLKLYLERSRERSSDMKYIHTSEENNSNRVSRLLIDEQWLIIDDSIKPRTDRQYIKSVQKNKSKKYELKQVHGYIHRKVKGDLCIGSTHSQLWLRDKYLTSHFVAYACAIQEQEILDQQTQQHQR